MLHVGEEGGEEKETKKKNFAGGLGSFHTSAPHLDHLVQVI